MHADFSRSFAHKKDNVPVLSGLAHFWYASKRWVVSFEVVVGERFS